MKSKNAQNVKKQSFWTTLPGILTALATLITAIAGLIAIFSSGGNSNKVNTSGGDTTKSNVIVLTPRFPSSSVAEADKGQILVLSGETADVGAFVYVDGNPEGLLAKQGNRALYLIHNMPPAQYEIEVKKNGATFQTRVNVKAGLRSTVDVVFHH